MCGRYTQTKSLKELAARFGTKVPDLKFTARYNVAPSQLAPVVINDNGRRLDLYKWGLIPVWAKEAAIGYKINVGSSKMLSADIFSTASDFSGPHFLTIKARGRLQLSSSSGRA